MTSHSWQRAIILRILLGTFCRCSAETGYSHHLRPVTVFRHMQVRRWARWPHKKFLLFALWLKFGDWLTVPLLEPVLAHGCGSKHRGGVVCQSGCCCAPRDGRQNLEVSRHLYGPFCTAAEVSAPVKGREKCRCPPGWTRWVSLLLLLTTAPPPPLFILF